MNLAKSLFICLILAFTSLASYFLLIGSGMFPSPDLALIGLVMVFILALSQSRKIFYFILLPLIIIHAFYTPTGLNFGAPSYQYIASLFATDLLETKEFLLQIPFTSYLIAFSIPVLLVAQYKLTQRAGINFYRNKTFLALSALLVAFHLPIANPLKETVNAGLKIMDEVGKLKAMTNSPSRWGVTELEAKYDDYVLIIGESARKDYHHAFGYPVENTPFMSQAKGTLIDGLRSAGTNTVASLRLMLTLPNKETWEPNYDLSLMDLLNSAGLETHWLSNQGYLGEFDTPVSSLASKAQQVTFMKKGGSFNSTNHSDFELLPKFAHILQAPSSKKRFIVLHIYGSHPLACDRLEDYATIFKEGQIDPKHHYLNCYISSIKKTDEFLARVYEQLKAHQASSQRSFSMVYFSDHGMCHQENGKEIVLNQNCFSQAHHDVPLFKLSSDDSEQKRYQAFKSGLNFVEGMATWVGIKHPLLDEKVDLFSNQPDPSDYGLADRIKEKYRKEADPAVDIGP
ncbi:hypothetical protein A4G20_03655 [Pasteurellaceae bacterium RH1A]|nr:hypothetical protein A4G20_03655 [Pasteurellaceae bacterium RH1A]